MERREVAQVRVGVKGTWYEILNSQALEYDGNGMGDGRVVVAGSGGAATTATTAIPQMGLVMPRAATPITG